jgi:hypothetical protein
VTKPSTADELVDIAEARYTFGRAPDGEPFAVEIDGRNLALPLRGGRQSFRAELAADYQRNHNKVPNSQALADALLVLEGKAQAQDPTPLALRVGRDRDRLVLDLGDEEGRAVVIEPGTWMVVERSPILFRRTELTSPLPLPVKHGDIDTLGDLLNVTAKDWPLVIGHLVATLFPDIPHPVVGFLGQQGSAKSVGARLVASVVDPSPAPLRSVPKDTTDWAAAAAASWVVTIDNISTISPWLSDVLCRACTGDGLIRRRLFTDSHVSVLAYRRVVQMTSIDPGALRGDLGERLLALDLERINGDDRRRESDIDAAFDDAHPEILGGLLDVAAAVLAEMPNVQPTRLDRMADFHHIVLTVDKVLDTKAGAQFTSQALRIAEDVIEGSEVGLAVRELAESNCDGWEGDTSMLLERLTPERAPKGWPTSPRGLVADLARVAPALSALGVDVALGDLDAETRRRKVTVEKVGK